MKKINEFAMLVGLSGMTLPQAAEFHRVSLDSATSWSTGRRNYPPGVVVELRKLIARQEHEAEWHLGRVRSGDHDGDGEYPMYVPADDDEARELGWPNVGAWKGMAWRVVAKSTLPLALVEYGAEYEPDNDNAPEMGR